MNQTQQTSALVPWFHLQLLLFCGLSIVLLVVTVSYAILDLDSLGKPVAGLLRGNDLWLGAYRECMDIDNAHYCSMQNLNIAGALPVHLGLCMPSVCSAQDATSLLQDIALELRTLTNRTLLEVAAGPATCYSKKKDFSNGAVVMIILSAVILTLCFLGTATEVLSDWIAKRKPHTIITNDEAEPTGDAVISLRSGAVLKHGHPVVNFLVCFSLIKNTRAIFDTNVPAGAITSINGIRMISMTWIILGHCLLFLPTLGLQDNVLDLLTTTQRFTFQVILNAEPAVDTFFMLSVLNEGGENNIGTLFGRGIFGVGTKNVQFSPEDTCHLPCDVNNSDYSRIVTSLRTPTLTSHGNSHLMHNCRLADKPFARYILRIASGRVDITIS